MTISDAFQSVRNEGAKNPVPFPPDHEALIVSIMLTMATLGEDHLEAALRILTMVGFKAGQVYERSQKEVVQ